MPVQELPPKPNLAHLKRQAKDLLAGHRARDVLSLQRIREFHPRFHEAADPAIAAADFALSDAQWTIAREHGFASWPRLKAFVEDPRRHDLRRPKHERIEDPTFRSAVDLIDAGNVAELRRHLRAHPGLVRQRVPLEGGNFFQNPTLLEFVAENPVRRGRLPPNIVEVANAILDAGATPASATATLELVASGRVPREEGVQAALVDALCDRGADPEKAMLGALAHGEVEAVRALLRRGARADLRVAAAMGRLEDAREALPAAGPAERHAALALAAQFGHAEVVRLLLDAGEDPSRYNPRGVHSHSTPLHQAALCGDLSTVRVLVERGARLDLRDAIHHATPLQWAEHAPRAEVAAYLRDRLATGSHTARSGID